MRFLEQKKLLWRTSLKNKFFFFFFFFFCRSSTVRLTPLKGSGNKLRCTHEPILTSLSLVSGHHQSCPGLRVHRPHQKKYFRKIKDYEKAYIEGKKAGRELELAVKIYKSHRRSFCNLSPNLNSCYPSCRDYSKILFC